MTSYHRSANFSVLPLREFACFVCLYVSCVQFVCLRLVVWNIHTTRRFFFLLPFRRNHLVPARNCEKRRRNKNTTFPQNNHWLRPTPKSTQSSWVLAGNFKGKLFDFNCFSVKKKKKNKNKIEAGLFGFQQVVPIRTYFLYHNLKKTKRKNLFSFAQVGMKNLLMGHFSRPKSPVKWNKICFSNSGWLVTILNFGIGRKGNWNRLMLQNRINVDGAKKDDIFGSVISVWQRKIGKDGDHTKLPVAAG